MKAQVPAGKTALRINMDETSVCLYQGNSKGTVIARKRTLREEAPGGEDVAAEPEQKVSRSLRRTCLTHVAFLCDRPDLQPLLPQVVVGNEHTFQARAWGALLAGAPRNVFLVRQKSAWNNHGLLARVLGLVAAALGPHLHDLQPIFLMDACKLHLEASVLKACFDLGLWPVIVPAKMT